MTTALALHKQPEPQEQPAGPGVHSGPGAATADPCVHPGPGEATADPGVDPGPGGATADPGVDTGPGAATAGPQHPPAGPQHPPAGPQHPPGGPQHPPSGPCVHDVGRLYVEFSRVLEALVRDDVRACDAVIEDACQVAWAQLMLNQHRVALQTAPRWLTKTAVREAVKLIRRHKRECSLELLLEEGADALGLSVDVEDYALAHRERLLGLESLPVRQQRMIWLRALGLSYDEVAAREGGTVRTVERQLWQARRRLRLLESGEAVD